MSVSCDDFNMFKRCDGIILQVYILLALWRFMLNHGSSIVPQLQGQKTNKCITQKPPRLQSKSQHRRFKKPAKASTKKAIKCLHKRATKCLYLAISSLQKGSSQCLQEKATLPQPIKACWHKKSEQRKAFQLAALAFNKNIIMIGVDCFQLGGLQN